jgi:prepilin-type processing-associated H-X9-DG protein
MPRNRRLVVVEILVVVACVIIVWLLLSSAHRRPRDESAKVHCQSNLSQIAKAMNMYLLQYGNNSMYAIPAQSFRGDCWLAELYWSGIVKEPKGFLCYNSDDSGTIPARRPANLALGSAIAPDAISYAGLCKGLTGRFAHRNTRTFTEAAISESSALACDDNEGTNYHGDGMNVVYFDGHTEFKPGTKAQTYDLIGAKGSPYEYLDSGEE